MVDGCKANGEVQSLYFSQEHPQAGLFKGMATILEEHGFSNAYKLKAQCGKNFNCKDTGTDSRCCCSQILFNQPDFVNVKTIVDETFNAQGFTIHFLLKFHPELNFIEQCWGYAKQLHQLNLETSCKDQLQRNALEALNVVPIQSMCQ